jgi:hypothetical protein
MNKKVQQFSLKACLLLFLTLGSIEGAYRFDPFGKHDLKTSYKAAIIDKYKRLENLKSPKIVLIAGSNFAYGINSQLIEQAFQQPVVNMALHYDYGTDFMLKQISPQLHTGDTVIMGFEYIVESKGNLGEKIQMMKYFPKAKEWFTYDNIFQFIGANSLVRVSAFKLLLERILKQEVTTFSVSDTTSIFFRGALNESGDLISHHNNPRLKVIPRAVINDKASLDSAIVDMNAFYSKMKKIGVKVYYIYPSYAESSYQFDKKIIEKLDKQLKKQALFPILGKPEDFVFADSLCQDMVYHLTKNGADIRTQKVIELLKKNDN